MFMVRDSDLCRSKIIHLRQVFISSNKIYHTLGAINIKIALVFFIPTLIVVDFHLSF